MQHPRRVAGLEGWEVEEKEEEDEEEEGVGIGMNERMLFLVCIGAPWLIKHELQQQL